MSKKKANKKMKPAPVRPVDRKLEEYSRFHQHPTNLLLQWISLPLLTFGILGIIWAVPFPKIEFLGSFNGYFNWASILIAIVIYYYYRLSPVLSYVMILIIGVYSYFIVQLEYWEGGGGPAFWLSSLVLFIIGVIGQLIGLAKEGNSKSIRAFPTFLLIGPLWLWSKILKKLNIPY